MASQPFTVVVPVFNAPEETGQCLDSLLATLPAEVSCLVIDDASPDPAVRDLLTRWVEKRLPGWRFERNTRNLGFVGTANRGMRESRGDVVLLNSDTIATPGWVEGMIRCLSSDKAIATATPWTNNGEIASLPEFCKANPVPPDLDAIAGAIASSGQPRYPGLPTAVGFCMGITRRAIDRVGLFDEALFGRGYGEENDFSLRAEQAGMSNVLCDDVYVAHVGGRSFGPLGLKPGEDSMARLLSRHPAYLEGVMSFIENDPLAERRCEVISAIERAGLRLR